LLARIPDEAASNEWDREWAAHILSLCLEVARTEFDTGTSRAFELYAIRQRRANEVATELGMTRNAVYIAKSRVLARLHDMFADFDEPTISL
jgi:RNA polymerase sigma-70 factor (ECF subfamily)